VNHHIYCPLCNSYVDLYRDNVKIIEEKKEAHLDFQCYNCKTIIALKIKRENYNALFLS